MDRVITLVLAIDTVTCVSQVRYQSFSDLESAFEAFKA